MGPIIIFSPDRWRHPSNRLRAILAHVIDPAEPVGRPNAAEPPR
jgi:hypothetical protein